MSRPADANAVRKTESIPARLPENSAWSAADSRTRPAALLRPQAHDSLSREPRVVDVERHNLTGLHGLERLAELRAVAHRLLVDAEDHVGAVFREDEPPVGRPIPRDIGDHHAPARLRDDGQALVPCLLARQGLDGDAQSLLHLATLGGVAAPGPSARDAALVCRRRLDQAHRDRPPLAAPAHDRHLHALAGLLETDRLLELRHRLHGFAVDGNDDVAEADTGALRG